MLRIPSRARLSVLGHHGGPASIQLRPLMIIFELSVKGKGYTIWIENIRKKKQNYCGR